MADTSIYFGGPTGPTKIKAIDNGDNTYSMAGGAQYTTRATYVTHRSAIAAADKVADLANTDLATADNGAATGSLNAGTTFYVTAVPGNRYGSCKVATTINTQATAASGFNTHSIRLTIPIRAGAEWYDIFLSTAAAPLWVGRITEAQRAAGDFEITAVGTVAAGGGNPAGTIDVNVVGTGVASNTICFSGNTALTPAAAGIATIVCTGRSLAHIMALVAVTDLRSQLFVALTPWLLGQDGVWYQTERLNIPLLTGLGNGLFQDFYLRVDGAAGLRVLVDTISGQGTTVTVAVELV
jgi:hypothetical protein